MAYGSFNQYDSPWGSKNYNGSSTMSGGGCGPTSCANILHNIDPSITPLTTMKYMQTHGDKDHAKFALYGQGTAWNGITQCLIYYGAQHVSRPDVSKSMTKVWDAMAKGHVAIFRMVYKKGLPGPTWTTSGHYLAIVGYKYKDKKHYVKVEDSGGRKHDGWYCYETQMRGWIPNAWTCLAVPKEIKPFVKPAGEYTGLFPTVTIKEGSKGTQTKWLQMFLNWYGKIKLTTDGIFGPKTAEALMRFQKTEGLTIDAVYGAKSQTAAMKYLPKYLAAVYSMAWPLGTAESKWKFKTGAPTATCKQVMQTRGYKNKTQYSDCGFTVNAAIYKATKRKVTTLPSNPKTAFPKTMEGLKLVHDGGKIKSGELKPGQIIHYKKTSGSQHQLTYLGTDGGVDVIAEGGREVRFFVCRKVKEKYNAKNVKHSTIQIWEVK